MFNDTTSRTDMIKIADDSSCDLTIVRRVSVTRLWGTKNIAFETNPDVNFLVGINGSGKTTVINLIAATLTGDLLTLSQTEFETITIYLSNPSASNKVRIAVHRADECINYSVESGGNEPITEQFHIAQIENMYRHNFFSRNYGHSTPPFLGTTEIPLTLDKLVQLQWLPITRSGRDHGLYDENRKGFSVDERLREQTSNLAGHFSYLNKIEERNLKDFQKKIFNSILQDRPSISDLLGQLNTIQLEKEEKILEDVFKEFNLLSLEYQASLRKHFSLLEKIKLDVNSNRSDIPINEFAALLKMYSAHMIVDEWDKYCQQRYTLYRSQSLFFKIFNDMTKGKTMTIDDRNQLAITTQSGKDLPIYKLSSGEKQLLIILSEALLQDQSTWIYIADEPELSLHVEWQEQLVRNITAINSSVQIIFATHSPDIVGPHQDKILLMEAITR